MRGKLLIMLLFPLVTFCQNYGDKSYYLLDSLDLKILSDKEKLFIDSCLNVYHKDSEDTVKTNSIFFMVEHIQNINVKNRYNLWLKKYSEDKLRSKENIFFYSMICSVTINNIALELYKRGEKEEALFFYKQSLDLNIKNKNYYREAIDLYEIGTIHYSNGKIKKALEFLNNSLKIFKSIKNEIGIATTLNNIGLIYRDQEELEIALRYFKSALKTYKSTENSHFIAIGLNNIGLVYLDLKDKEEALRYFNQALELYKQINNTEGVAISFNNIGVAYKKDGENIKAKNNFRKALDSYKKINSKSGIAKSLINLGSILYIEHNIKEAESFLSQGFELSKELNSPSMISKSSSILSEISYKNNDFKRAYQMHVLYVKMRDSINNIETQKASIKLASKYSYEKQKALDDLENKKKIGIEKEAKEKQRIIIYFTIIGLVIFAIFLMFVINRLRITTKQKRIIEEQKQTLEVANKKTEQQKEVLEETHKEITDSIKYAKSLQDAILPSVSEINKHLKNNFIIYKPKDVVSGDFYWFDHKVINGREMNFIAVADCTGHGVPGAMVSVVCSDALNRAVNEFNLISPSQILDKTREIVVATFAKGGENEVKDGMDIALCLISKDKLIYSGAYNPLWIVRENEKINPTQLEQKSTVTIGESSLIEYKADRQPVGLHRNMVLFKQVELKIEVNDIIYIFTDGFPDQFGGKKGKKFKYRQFKELLIQASKEPMVVQKEMITEKLYNWMGTLEQVDDICIIGVKP